MTGLREFHPGLIDKRYGFNRPGLEPAHWGGFCAEVHDPFGNRIRFASYDSPANG